MRSRLALFSVLSTLCPQKVADIVLADRLGERLGDARAEDHPGLTGHWWSASSGMVYSIADHEGALRMGMCAGPALPLRPDPDGRLRLRTGAIGDIVIGARSDAAGFLPVRFGCSEHLHERLVADAAQAARFAATACGRYGCEDADCHAVIEQTAEGLRLILSDPYGRSEMMLEPLGDRVALARRQVGQLPFGLALTLLEGGGFHVGTSRTRFLAFAPV